MMILNETKFDVIIVGAGPAGCTAAFNLAWQGFKVALIEKEKLVRQKPCGGGLSARVLDRFPYFKEEIESVILNRVFKVYLYSPKFNFVKVESEQPFYLMVKRSDFDLALANKCRGKDVVIFESTKAERVNIGKDYVEVTAQNGLKLAAKGLIGADGLNSVVRKQTGLDANWSKDNIAVCLVKETEDIAEQLEDQQSAFIFYGFRNIPGYGWVFPKKQCANIGVGALMSWQGSKKNITNIYYEFIKELKKQNIIPPSFNPDGFKAWSIPFGGPLPKTYSERVVLCGDAAGLVHSYTGEGIYYAMVSGEIAGKIVSQAIKENDLSERRLSEYQQVWEKEIGEELEKSLLISRLLFRKHKRVERIVQIAKEDSNVSKILTEYSVGRIDYKTFRDYVIRRLLPAYLKQKIKAFF